MPTSNGLTLCDNEGPRHTIACVRRVCWNLLLASKSALAGGADVCGICTLDILSARDCAINACRHTFHRDCILEYTGDQISSPQALGKDDDGKGKGKRPAAKKRGKKGKTKDIVSTAKTCPVCYLPLQLTLDLRGMGDTEDEDDDGDDGDDRSATPDLRRLRGRGVEAGIQT